MRHSKLCPRSHPQLSQKVLPQSAQAPYGWHTPTCEHTYVSHKYVQGAQTARRHWQTHGPLA